MGISLRLLGEFRLLTGDPAVRVAVPNGQAATLLKLLALHRNHVVPIEAVVDALWPDQAPGAAGQIVASLVSRLRRGLGADLQRLEGGYRLDTTRWTVDLAEATRLIRAGERHLDAGEPALADAAARRAVTMLSFALLDGSPAADWLARARLDHDALIRRARRLAWRTADAVGDHARARVLAEAAIADDPLDEAAYRALMLAHYRCGQRALALRAYARLAGELGEQLGSAPDPATGRLHVAILRGAEIRPVRAAARAPDLIRPSRTLLGRDDVLDRAEALWRETAGGACRSLLVRGAPGSGRTAVLAEIVRYARATGGAVLAGACVPGLPLHPIAGALRSFCATAHPDVIRATIAGFEDVACQLVPELAEPVRPAAPAILRPTRLVEAIAQIVTRLAAEQPLLIAIDDLDAADRLTLSALTVLRDRLAGSPAAMVATAGPGCPAPPFTTAPTLRLAPLSRRATTQLAERLQLGRLAGVIHALTAGHPGFVVEALHAAQRGANLTGELPDTLVDAALARIERAGPGMVDALTTVAALGPRFTGRHACRALTGGGLAVLRRAVTAGLLVTDGEHLAFESELLRAALLRPVLGLDAEARIPAA